MALVSGRGSTLNPNARPFVPAVYRQVEDFSSEWYNLVQNSTWFRDYWLSEHQETNTERYSEPEDDDITNLLPDTFDFGYNEEFPYEEAEFEGFVKSFDTYQNSGLRTEMKAPNGIGLNAEAYMRSLNSYSPSNVRGGMSTLVEPAKYSERPTQRISSNHGPKRIHQPR